MVFSGIAGIIENILIFFSSQLLLSLLKISQYFVKKSDTNIRAIDEAIEISRAY